MSNKLEKMRDELAADYYSKHLCSDKPSFKDGFDAADAHYRPIVEALELRNQALLEQAEGLADVIYHALALKHFTPGSSTEGWAKQTIKNWQEFKK